MTSFAPSTEFGRLLLSPPAAPQNPRSDPYPLGRSSRAFISFSSSIRAPSADMTLCERNGRAPVVAAGRKYLMGSLTKADGLKFAVVVARFNEIITNLLLEGALGTFRQYSVDDKDVTVVKVPGSFEVPFVAQKLGKSGNFDAILCIGAVIRGDTSHYDAVANSAASGVLNAGLSSGVPCIFGVLTCDNMEQPQGPLPRTYQLVQALDRAGGKSGNKGAEAALTAIEMASLFKHQLVK